MMPLERAIQIDIDKWLDNNVLNIYSTVVTDKIQVVVYSLPLCHIQRDSVPLIATMITEVNKENLSILCIN